MGALLSSPQQRVVLKVRPHMGDTEAVLGLDGLKEEAAGAGQEKVRSVSTGSSRGSAQLEVKLPWYMGITCKDVRAILPTLIILFVGLLIMILVIPYAFSSVFRQLEMERTRNLLHANQSLATGAAN